MTYNVSNPRQITVKLSKVCVRVFQQFSSWTGGRRINYLKFIEAFIRHLKVGCSCSRTWLWFLNSLPQYLNSATFARCAGLKVITFSAFWWRMKTQVPSHLLGICETSLPERGEVAALFYTAFTYSCNTCISSAQMASTQFPPLLTLSLLLLLLLL